MYLFLIRHTESEKNKENHFSSLKDDECLTPKGELDAEEIAKHISDFVAQHSYKCRNIYSANSARSINLAQKIASLIQAQILVEEGLRSTRPGVLAGANKDEVKTTHPEYAQQYYLFEKGVFNVYDFKNPEKKEPKRDFERRVNECVERIISDKSEDIKIIVGHRSSITAILLHFARKFHNYPENFSGHVPLDLGCISILRKTDNDNWEIVKVNEKYDIINEL
jgi:broad specificity phosphatase PhoE